MKSLYITRHKTNLTNILLDIYKHSELATCLGFKGGTAAMFFYGLPRFSTDLDFDLIVNCKTPQNLKIIINSINKLLSSKYIIKDQIQKHHTLFWLLSYGAGLSQIKIEISTRKQPFNHYEIKSLYGIKINTLSIQDMIAHKLVAILDRSSLANRDLFDVHFFLSTPYANNINHQIIRYRTKKYPHQFYSELLNFIDKINPKLILSGLGEVLDNQAQKDRVKTNLIPELIIQITRQKELFPKKLIYKKNQLIKPTSGDYQLYQFSFLLNNQTEITFPLKISNTLIAILGPSSNEIQNIFKAKIKNFLMLNPTGVYQTKPITTYEAKNLQDLKKFKINSLVV